MRRVPRKLRVAACSAVLLSAPWGAGSLRAQPLDAPEVPERPPAFATQEDRPTRLEESPLVPWRWISWVGAGASVRPLVQERFQQSRMAPPFLEVSSGVLWPLRLGGGRLWTGLDATLGLARDGTVASGVRPFEQFVVGPSVRWMRPIHLHGPSVLDGWWWLSATAPVALAPSVAPGLQGAVGAAWALRAGLGFYAEAALAAFAGGAPAGERSGFTLHPLLGVEAGFFVDWEVLP